MSIKIIAEAAQGYEGNYHYARLLVKAAAEAKADSVKFQLVYADELCTPEYEYQSLFKSLELRDNEWLELKKYASSLKINLEFDIFGSRSLKLSEKLKIKNIKLHPTDIVNFGLLRKVKQSSIENVCLGVGGSTLREISNALDILYNKNVNVMIGFQNYPTPTKTNNINRISSLKNFFKGKYKNISYGFADHEVAESNLKYILPAVALGAGATVIEKHFTLSNELNLEDSETALNPKELKTFCDLIRNSSKGIGTTSLKDDFNMSQQEKNYRHTIRRHVVASKKLIKGKIINEKDITLKRTSSQKPIKDLSIVIGNKLNKAININQPITLEDLERNE